MNNDSKKKITSKQVVAMSGVIVLVLLYVITLILAIVDHSASGMLFGLSLAMTFIIPIILYLYIWMTGRLTGKKIMGDPTNDQNDNN